MIEIALDTQALRDGIFHGLLLTMCTGMAGLAITAVFKLFKQIGG